MGFFIRPTMGAEGGVRSVRTTSHLRHRHRRRGRVRPGAGGRGQAGDGERRLDRRRRSGARRPAAGAAPLRTVAIADGPRRLLERIGAWRGDRTERASDPQDGDHGRGGARRRPPPAPQFRSQRAAVRSPIWRSTTMSSARSRRSATGSRFSASRRRSRIGPRASASRSSGSATAARSRAPCGRR